MGRRLDEERAQSGGTGTRQEFVQADGVVHYHPEGHQHDPPGQPRSGAARHRPRHAARRAAG